MFYNLLGAPLLITYHDLKKQNYTTNVEFLKFLFRTRRKRNIETGSHLTLTAQTLRVIQARGQGTHQKTARQQRRRKRRRSTRGSTRSESATNRGVVERRKNQEPCAWLLERLSSENMASHPMTSLLWEMSSSHTAGRFGS